ncbi:MAG: hypothetical protein EOM76_11120 [Sphingobacteriia bacterium]|nr:hypothetical protein [Sphingobacteriia bacterium]
MKEVIFSIIKDNQSFETNASGNVIDIAAGIYAAFESSPQLKAVFGVISQEFKGKLISINNTSTNLN